MTLFAAAVAILAATLFSSSAVQALSIKTFVATGGADTGICSATMPCLSFSYAYDQTMAGGEIFCLTPGRFSSLTIAKAITIDCQGTGAIIGSETSNGFLSIATAASDRVILRGLSGAALSFDGSGTLILDQVSLGSGTINGGNALVFQPIGAGKLVVTDSLFTNGGTTSSNAGILVKPNGNGGTAQVTLSRSTVTGNAFGVAVDGSGGIGGINVTINDSDLASNVQDGIVATSSPSGAPIGVFLSNSRSANNGYGVRSIGSNVTVRVKDSSIIGNGVGLSGGGALISGGNNTVQGNATNGGFNGSYALQ